MVLQLRWQQCLIHNTISAEREIDVINELIEQNRKSIKIIVYGENSCDLSIIKKYEHIVIQGANVQDLCFYKFDWKEHLWRLEQENFEFYYCNHAVEDDLLWANGIFETELGDNIQKRWDMNLTDGQIKYLERFIDNNSIDTIMKGSEIRLIRLLESIGIPYKLIKDVQDENIDIWTTR